MKKSLLVFLALITFTLAGKAQSMNCSDFCVLKVDNVDDSVNHVLDVTIYHGGTTFMNYPVVLVVNTLGDTIANINSMFYFFGHLPGDTLVHTIPTTVDSITGYAMNNFGFTGTVYYTDYFDTTTCSYSYPTPCTVGINETLADVGFSVYPNPASTQINVSISGTGNFSSKLHLYDLTGKLVKTLSTSERDFILERGNLAGGIYFLQIVSGEKVLTKKIILE